MLILCEINFPAILSPFKTDPSRNLSLSLSATKPRGVLYKLAFKYHIGNRTSEVGISTGSKAPSVGIPESSRESAITNTKLPHSN